MERRLLQITVAILGLAPVGAGLAGVVLGPSMLNLWGGPALDSHYRYLSGLLLGVGLAYWSAIPTIERAGERFSLLTLLVVIGGLGRAISMLRFGPPGRAMGAALALELIVAPLVYLWQMRVARTAAMDLPSPWR